MNVNCMRVKKMLRRNEGYKNVNALVNELN